MYLICLIIAVIVTAKIFAGCKPLAIIVGFLGVYLVLVAILNAILRMLNLV